VQEIHTASDDTEARRRARTHLTLAAGYFQDGKTSVALDEAKQAMQSDPTFSDSYDLAGLIYMQMNDYGLAQAHFEKALSINPNDGGAMHNMGWLKCQQKQYDEATTWFQRAIAAPRYNGRAKTWLAQGACEMARGDNAKAEQSLMQSFDLDPGNPVTGYNLAKLMYERGDLQHAQFYIRRINNSQEANAETLWLGIKVEHKLKNSEAVEQLALQLRKRFADSKQLASYEKGAFDD
jgi:type IV pilus assembly protein PilF